MPIFTAQSSHVGGAVYEKVLLKYDIQNIVCSMPRLINDFEVIHFHFAAIHYFQNNA